jgi:serine/threonine protein kinase
MEYYGITFIGNALFFGFFALICLKRMFDFIFIKKKKHKIWIPIYILLFFCTLVRGGSLIYFGLTLDPDNKNEKAQEVLMSTPYMVYLFLYLLMILHFLVYYINAHINLANDRNIFINEIPNLTRKSIIMLIIVFPLFVIVFGLMSLFALLEIIAQWTLIKMISIFNIASPGILIIYYVFLNIKFSGRPYRDENSKIKTRVIIKICIFWSATRIISGIIYLAFKIKDLRSLLYDDVISNDGDEKNKTINIIFIFLFFILLEVFPTYFSLEDNLVKTFVKEQHNPSNELIIENNDLNENIIRNSVDSSTLSSKGEQELQRGSSINSNNIKIDIKNYLVNEEEITVGEKIFERKNGLGINNKGIYKKEDVIIRIIQFDRLSRYNIQDITNDIEQILPLNYNNISNIIGYSISNDNKVILIYKEFKNGSLYDYIHVKDKKLSKEEKIKIVKGIINGIHYLHNNHIVHCHLSSKNILLDEELNPFIVDFGFKNLYELANLFNKYINKSGYSAPEILSTSGKFFKIPENINDNIKKIDIYSFGMIIWEIITNTVPFEVKLPEIKKYVLEEKVRPEVPINTDKNLSNLIRNCWDSELDKRPNESELIEFFNLNEDIFNN